MKCLPSFHIIARIIMKIIDVVKSEDKNTKLPVFCFLQFFTLVNYVRYTLKLPEALMHLPIPKLLLYHKKLCHNFPDSHEIWFAFLSILTLTLMLDFHAIWVPKLGFRLWLIISLKRMHDMNQCWLITYWMRKNKLEWNLNIRFWTRNHFFQINSWNCRFWNLVNFVQFVKY